MIDLIKEIEKLKLSDSFITGEYSFGFTDGKNQTIKEVLELLNQYNIITAPKTIKLSEIVDRLQQYHSDEEIYFNKELNAIGSGEYDDTWFANSWIPCVYFQDNKIHKIITQSCEATKWLYTLWIAGTKIIDDLEGQDEKQQTENN